ncbi:MAG: dynamin family protein, partial [Pseudanabaenaceae cyanobacterium]
MSSDDLKSDIYAIQQSVVDVLTQVRDLMNYASQKLESSSGKERRYAEHAKSIENEITKVKNLELRMAIAAPMKAGKSTIINAIVGQDILPSRNAAMTTLPTEIIFSKDVTEPKLRFQYDGSNTYDVLKRSWGSLKRKIQQIGLAQATQEIRNKDYTHLQNLLEDIAGNPEIAFLSEVSGTEAIQKSLTDLNDLVRLCSVLVPLESPLLFLDSVPRIEVPFLDETSGLKLDSVGKLVIVDTPGPNEAGDLNLGNVVKLQLEASSIILLVLDYTQLNAEAAEKVKLDVEKIVSDIKGKDSIYILVNKIDLRKTDKDMSKEQVLEFVQNKFGIQGSSDRVFEISASRAAYASNFWNEKKQGSVTPQEMKTSDLLGMQYYGDSWRKKFQKKVDMDDMEEAANDVWSESGFAEFLEKAIAVLMAQAAPRTLSSALNDASGRLTDLQNNTNIQKGSFGQNLAKLQAAIDALENDLRKLIDCRDKLKEEVARLRKSLEQQLSSNLVAMQAESRGQLERIFGRREYREAGLVKKAGLGLNKLLSLLSGQDYQGTGEIKFKSANEANRFVETATASVKMIVNDLMSDAREDAWREVKSLRNRIEKLLRTKTKPIIEQAQRRLSKQFDVTLELPEMFDEINLEDVSLDIQAKSRSREYTEYQTVRERRWYTLWLYEHTKQVPVSRTERFFVVSVDEVNQNVEESIEGAVTKVKQQVFKYLEQDFQMEIDRYFLELDQLLKGYEESLQESINFNKQNAEKQAERKAA